MAVEAGSGGSITIDGSINLDSANEANEGDLNLSADLRITLDRLNFALVRNVTFAVGQPEKNWHWVLIESDPLNCTTNVGGEVLDFASVNSHVYYRDTPGVGLDGTYPIADSGHQLIGLAAGQQPPEFPTACTIFKIW